MESKKCTKCLTEKPLCEFNKQKNTKDGLRYYCKSCWKDYKLDWSRRNKGKVSKINRKQRYSHCVNYKETETRYLVTNNCECCGKTFDDTKANHKCVDHKDDQIRGIICHSCNLGIGLLSDQIEGLEKAINYLKRSGV